MRRRLVKAYANEDWMKEIIKCQEEIAVCNQQYRLAYMPREIGDWFHIPEWMYEDHTENGIGTCLDIGCAYGTLVMFAKRVSGCHAYCIDRESTRLDKSLAGKYGLLFETCNIETDTLPWHLKFDAIVLTEVLEHLSFNPVPTLRKISGLLSERGRLYLSTPDSCEYGTTENKFKHWSEMPYPDGASPMVGGDRHTYVFSREELMEVIEKGSLKIERLAHSPGDSRRHFNVVAVKKK